MSTEALESARRLALLARDIERAEHILPRREWHARVVAVQSEARFFLGLEAPAEAEPAPKLTQCALCWEPIGNEKAVLICGECVRHCVRVFADEQGK